MANCIEEREVALAQRRWAGGIVDIGTALLEEKDYRTVAETLVAEMYGYREGTVLFKPTKAREKAVPVGC